MRKSLSILLLALTAFFIGSCRWTNEESHQYSASVSAEVAASIKKQLIANLGKLADQNFAKQFQADLNQSDDSKRTLKSMSALSANQIFGILKLPDPGCDKNQDGQVSGDELKCLNYIWKAYLPH